MTKVRRVNPVAVLAVRDLIADQEELDPNSTEFYVYIMDMFLASEAIHYTDPTMNKEVQLVEGYNSVYCIWMIAAMDSVGHFDAKEE